MRRPHSAERMGQFRFMASSRPIWSPQPTSRGARGRRGPWAPLVPTPQAKVRELPEGAGASCYFDIASGTYLKDSGSVASQFSYIQLNPEGFISNIVEKQVISKMANTGAYIFRSGRDTVASRGGLSSGPLGSSSRP